MKTWLLWSSLLFSLQMSFSITLRCPMPWSSTPKTNILWTQLGRTVWCPVSRFFTLEAFATFSRHWARFMKLIIDICSTVTASPNVRSTVFFHQINRLSILIQRGIRLSYEHDLFRFMQSSPFRTISCKVLSDPSFWVFGFPHVVLSIGEFQTVCVRHCVKSQIWNVNETVSSL